jgi:hypothetical protein
VTDYVLEHALTPILEKVNDLFVFECRGILYDLLTVVSVYHERTRVTYNIRYISDNVETLVTLGSPLVHAYVMGYLRIVAPVVLTETVVVTLGDIRQLRFLTTTFLFAIVSAQWRAHFYVNLKIFYIW